MIRLASPIPAIALLAACSPQPPPCDTDELSIEGELCFGPVESALAVVEEFPAVNPGGMGGDTNRFWYFVASPVPGYCDTLRAVHAAVEARLDDLLGGDPSAEVACEDAAAAYREAAKVSAGLFGGRIPHLRLDLRWNGASTPMIRSQTWWTQGREGELGLSEQIWIDLITTDANKYDVRADSLVCSGRGTGQVLGLDSVAIREGLGPWFTGLGQEHPVEAVLEPSDTAVPRLVADDVVIAETNGGEDRTINLSFDLTLEECRIEHRYNVWTFSFQMGEDVFHVYGDRPI